MEINMNKIDLLIEKAKKTLASHTPNPPGYFGPTLSKELFSEWKSQTLAFLISSFGDENHYTLSFKEQVKYTNKGDVEKGIGILKAIKEDDNRVTNKTVLTQIPISQIENICEKFHLIARQLQKRRSNRETIKIEDEYDVQDLMRALLYLYFEDIRPEENTPSHAAKSSRMDFLLKKEAIIIELKMTREGLSGKELSSQLIEDKERYKAHPDCRTLICFVYDPTGSIDNPRGIEQDLRENGEKCSVRVIIRP